MSINGGGDASRTGSRPAPPIGTDALFAAYTP